jgi:hypothetical protein
LGSDQRLVHVVSSTVAGPDNLGEAASQVGVVGMGSHTIGAIAVD